MWRSNVEGWRGVLIWKLCVLFPRVLWQVCVFQSGAAYNWNWKRQNGVVVVVGGRLWRPTGLASEWLCGVAGVCFLYIIFTHFCPSLSPISCNFLSLFSTTSWLPVWLHTVVEFSVQKWRAPKGKDSVTNSAVVMSATQEQKNCSWMRKSPGR